MRSVSGGSVSSDLELEELSATLVSTPSPSSSKTRHRSKRSRPSDSSRLEAIHLPENLTLQSSRSESLALTLILGVFLWLIVGLSCFRYHQLMLISSGNRFWSGDNGPAGRARCENPYREPGSLYRHPSDGSMTSWIPLETGCLPAPNYIGMIRQAQIDLMVDGTSKKFIRDPEGLNFLRNRTILILGDSVDRNSLQHFCQLISRPIRLTTWGGSNQTDNLDHRGLPHLCRIDELDFSAVNGFHYGMDDIDLFNDPNRHPDWHSPGKFEDRLEELISPYLRSHIPGSRRKPSLVVWSSGLWDVAFFGTEDERRNSSFHSALDRGRLDWWMSRARQTITSTRHHFPDSLLVMRMMHRVNGDSEETGWMQDVRVHQIREAQSELAREVDFFEVLDFGTIFEGYQQYQEKVHPLPNPGSIIFQAYLHYLKLAVQYDLI